MRKALTLLLLTVLITPVFAQGITAKREFRCVWIATVTNIDWPSSGSAPDVQKKAMITLLDQLKAANINAVLFQVRTECDALYNSSYEPWSYWLTGTQGKAPSPYYDPLEFVVTEGHKRGMEVHAWINPYRAVKTVGSYTASSQHVSVQHPEWIVTYSNLKVLNPGIPEVREYDTKIIMDIVRRYDIDGIHFDDYFYPYPATGYTFQDDATFQQYNRGFTDKGDWRRDNVNLLVKMVHDSIQAVKPYVKFGISPFGIWKSGYPSGISGMSAYSDIYCDALAWLNQKTVDYITPQLYWKIGGGQDYTKLMPWWGTQAANNGRHFYPGHAIYQISSWGASEMPNQIKLDKGNANCQGSVLYSAQYIPSNPLGFADSLKNNYYKYPALWPVMKWKDTLPPNPVQNVRYEKLASTGSYGLKWDQPVPASDKDQGAKFVVYKFKTSNISNADLDNPANIYAVIASTEYTPQVSDDNTTSYFTVTALDHYGNESKMSNVASVEVAAPPVIASPIANALNQRDTVTLKWNPAKNASYYYLTLCKDSALIQPLLNKDAIADTFLVVTGMDGQQKYFWGVKSENVAGTSVLSQVNSFTTGFTVKPTLLEPAHASTNVPTNVAFKWAKTPLAKMYRFQLAYGQTINDQTIVNDTTGLTDTVITFKNLVTNKAHYWRVSALNDYGQSLWSSTFGFKTSSVSAVAGGKTVPEEFALEQNYPNPFNPGTVIQYRIPKAGHVSLKIYDILGREVAVLVNEVKNAGSYSVEFNSQLSSGIYYYTLNSCGFMSTKKMVVLK